MNRPPRGRLGVSPQIPRATVKRKRPRRRLRRYVPHFAAAILLAIAILLFIQLERLNTPPLQENGGKTPAKAGARAIWQWSLYGSGKTDESAFFLPYQAVVDPKGRIFVADTGNSRIVYFTKDRRHLGTLKGSADGKIYFDEPLGLTFAGNGDLYIADRGASKIIVLDKRLRLKRTIAEAIPIAPVIGPDNRLYVANYDSIGVYTMDGKPLAHWGTRGREPGQFDFPNGVVVTEAKAGVVYVSDSNNHRLQVLSRDAGKPLWSIGRPVADMNERPIEFDLPAGLAADEDGFLYLVDTFDDSIRILDTRGEEVATVGDFGSADGLFSYPVSITYLGDHRFLVGDRGNNRIQAIDIFPPAGIAAGEPKEPRPGGERKVAGTGDGPGIFATWGAAIMLGIAALMALAAGLILRRGKTAPTKD